jgi:hypothetical protein
MENHRCFSPESYGHDEPSRSFVGSPANYSHAQQDDNNSLDTIDRELRDSTGYKGIVTDAPREEFRLGYISVMFLVVNRMIGSGIFMTPKKVITGTQSTGVSLLFWFAGILYALAGMHVYIEFGLNVPRVVYKNVEQSVARSGGELNYVSASILRNLGIS